MKTLLLIILASQIIFTFEDDKCTALTSTGSCTLAKENFDADKDYDLYECKEDGGECKYVKRACTDSTTLTDPEKCPFRDFNYEYETCVKDGDNGCKLEKIDCGITISVTTPETTCPLRTVDETEKDYLKCIKLDDSSCTTETIDCEDKTITVTDPENCKKRKVVDSEIEECKTNGEGGCQKVPKTCDGAITNTANCAKRASNSDYETCGPSPDSKSCVTTKISCETGTITKTANCANRDFNPDYEICEPNGADKCKATKISCATGTITNTDNCASRGVSNKDYEKCEEDGDNKCKITQKNCDEDIEDTNNCQRRITDFPDFAVCTVDPTDSSSCHNEQIPCEDGTISDPTKCEYRSYDENYASGCVADGASNCKLALKQCEGDIDDTDLCSKRSVENPDYETCEADGDDQCQIDTKPCVGSIKDATLCSKRSVENTDYETCIADGNENCKIDAKPCEGEISDPTLCSKRSVEDPNNEECVQDGTESKCKVKKLHEENEDFGTMLKVGVLSLLALLL